MIQTAINGFGRIGRTAVRVYLNRPDLREKINLAAINTSGSMEIEGWAHLLSYDTSYHRLPYPVGVEKVRGAKEATDEEPLLGYLTIQDQKIPVLAQKDPEKIRWQDYQVEVVIEATGVFRDQKGAGKHLTAGAKKVVISAPSKGEGVSTQVLSVSSYDGSTPLVDNASCTTNCIAPVTAVVTDKFGIKKAALTTVHAYTDDQNLQDGSHREDLRRARAGANNIVPTSTGAATATAVVIPTLKNKFDGIAIRVPVITGSLSDLTYLVERQTSVDEVNAVIKEAASQDRYRGIIGWTEEPLVSSDIVGRSESAVVDLSMTQVIDGDLVKILAWYDNEWGYCNRLMEQVAAIS